MQRRRVPIVCLAVALAVGCGSPAERERASGGLDAQGNTVASPETQAANQRAGRALPLADAQDFEDARRGLIGGDGDVVITNAAGVRIWDTTADRFVDGEAPPSVNPSLWRQAKLNGIHGLFRVVDGVYRLRDMLFSDDLHVDGSRMDVFNFFSLLDRPDGKFAIVTP